MENMLKQVGGKELAAAERAIVDAVISETPSKIDEARENFIEVQKALDRRHEIYVIRCIELSRAQAAMNAVAFGLELDLRTEWDREFIGMSEVERDDFLASVPAP